MANVKLTIRLNDELLKEIRSLAALDDRSINNYIENTLYTRVVKAGRKLKPLKSLRK